MSKYANHLTTLSLSAAFIGCGLSHAQHSTTPTGWTEHRDAAGFSVELPQDWTAETSVDRHLMFRSADSKDFAYALPFELPGGGSAFDRIAPMVKQLSLLFPSARIAKSERIAGTQDEAIAKISFNLDGEAAQANILCAVANGRGVFYAIAAPADQFAAKSSVLCRILNSVRTIKGGEAKPQVRKDIANNSTISYISWIEPNEHAFSVSVPAGWKVTGGIFRMAPVDVRPQVDAGTEDGQIYLQFGDANIGTFAAPGPSSQTRGKSEGQSYEVNGVTYTVMRPVSGAEFSRVYVERNIGKKYTGVEVTSSRNLEEESAAATSKYRKLNMDVTVSCGETQFICTHSGTKMSGICHVKVEVWGHGIGQTWRADPNLIVATPERLETARSVSEHMIKSTTEDPHWAANAQKTSAEFNHLIMQNHEAAMQQLHDVYAKFTRNLAENQRQWSNIINNQADVVNKNTGETMKVDGNYSYYFAGGGGVVGSNSANGGGLTPLTKY
jgi:hypothetical protein